jgi:hypothetical protein
MAMEMHVFSNRALTAIAEWQRVIDAEKFPLRLSSDVDLKVVRGFLPARLRGKATGFECYHDDAMEMMASYGHTSFDRAWSCAFGFRWIGNFTEFEAAWMAAAAYARATGGVIFDPEDSRLYTSDEAVAFARRIERELPALEAAVRNVSRKFAKDGKSPR